MTELKKTHIEQCDLQWNTQKNTQIVKKTWYHQVQRVITEDYSQFISVKLIDDDNEFDAEEKFSYHLKFIECH